MTFSAAAAAERLGVNESTVRRWVSRGWLAPVLGSDPLRFREDDLEAAYVARRPPSWHARLDAVAATWRACP